MKEDEIEITEVYDKRDKIVRQYLNYGKTGEVLINEIPVSFTDYSKAQDFFKA